MIVTPGSAAGAGVGAAGVFTGGGGASPLQVVVIALSGCAQLITPSIVNGISLARDTAALETTRKLVISSALSRPRNSLRMVKYYFFLNPVGHFGLTAVTFLVLFPFMQVIVFFVAVISACFKFMVITGAEK